MELERFFSEQVKAMRSSEIRDLLKITEGREVISLAGGLPDPSTFPREDIKKIAEDIMDKNWERALQYTATGGVEEFKKQLISLSSLRGISKIREENLFVTVGSQEALYMLANLLIDPGDQVAVEMPTYLAALNAMRLRKPNFLGVELTEEGANLDQLEERAKKTRGKLKLFYTIPTAQNPGGVTMGLEGRKRLLEIASDYDFLVVEDDAYGFLVFDGDAPPSLKALDTEGRVIYTSTFSKILAPGFRLGWVVAEPEVISKLEMMKQNVDLHTPSFTQYIAAEAIRRGVIQSNFPKVRAIYKRKRDVMLDSLEAHFPKSASWSRPKGGMFVFAKVSEKLDTGILLEEALRKGVAYVPGASFYHDFSGRNTMRLNFSFPPEEKLREGIRILGDLLKEKL
ncbi:aminotransferase [Sulfodiicoccus acidiphilus]|nr:PLP-dependent aminotransferase family protein [Sulfodiicoccus acidiphilus]GGT96027.1 aminotransferase [Sulfodiicoccus acidiphilus]